MKGEVTLQVTPTYKYGYLQAPYDDPIRVVKAIKGKTDVTIDLQSDARCVVVVVVSEELEKKSEGRESLLTKESLFFICFSFIFRLKGDYARELEVTAYVKEELTERVQNATSHVTVYRYPYRLSLIRTSDSFKPGLTYTAFVSYYSFSCYFVPSSAYSFTFSALVCDPLTSSRLGYQPQLFYTFPLIYAMNRVKIDYMKV